MPGGFSDSFSDGFGGVDPDVVVPSQPSQPSQPSVVLSDLDSDNSGFTKDRRRQEWYRCQRCDWYYPREKMINQNGLNVCKGTGTHDCYDRRGHAAEYINLDVPYEQNPEPLPWESTEL
jgi:hypothetical protein